MGNFVFQFPSLNVRTSYHSNETETSVFFYDITQIYYLLMVGQQCGLIELSEELSEYDSEGAGGTYWY